VTLKIERHVSGNRVSRPMSTPGLTWGPFGRCCHRTKSAKPIALGLPSRLHVLQSISHQPRQLLSLNTEGLHLSLHVAAL
jgi:hypothetical protein